MDVPAQISQSMLRSAGFPSIIPFMLISQRMIWTSFANMDHGTWISREKKRVWAGILFPEHLTWRITGKSAHLTKLGLLWACTVLSQRIISLTKLQPWKRAQFQSICIISLGSERLFTFHLNPLILDTSWLH